MVEMGMFKHDEIDRACIGRDVWDEEVVSLDMCCGLDDWDDIYRL